jgi:hypothetical protein
MLIERIRLQFLLVSSGSLEVSVLVPKIRIMTPYIECA